MRCFTYLLILISCAAAAGTPLARKDVLASVAVDTVQEVTHLPGYSGALPSRQYSGYITVSEPHERRLFYWLVTSEGPDPAKAPLVLWLTGGPGCSSLDAFTYENGPFSFGFRDETASKPQAEDVVLTRNPHAWARAANILYVDSPAGTGLSYSKVEGDYSTNDANTIDDLYAFVLDFYELFPEYYDRDLYISGESYAGVYVPLLAQRILDGNDPAAAARQPSTNKIWQNRQQSSDNPASPRAVPLVGYMVGNAVTDDHYDEGASQIEFALNHGLIDPDTHDTAMQACQGDAQGKACKDALSDMKKKMGDINLYDLLEPCFSSSSSSSSSTRLDGRAYASQRKLKAAGAVPPYEMYRPRRRMQQLRSTSNRMRVDTLGHTIACADRRAGKLWFNDAGVRKAIHGAPLEVSGRWEPCSDVLDYDSTGGSMIPVHADLIKRGMRALVLSGDHDFIVPFEGTRAWVYSMDMNPVKPWAPWHLEDGHNGRQVAGYYVVFKEGLIFASVKGAGHMVPQTKPEASLRLLQLFLNDEL